MITFGNYNVHIQLFCMQKSTTFLMQVKQKEAFQGRSLITKEGKLSKFIMNYVNMI